MSFVIQRRSDGRFLSKDDAEPWTLTDYRTERFEHRIEAQVQLILFEKHYYPHGFVICEWREGGERA